jgi:predicted solute-binding protein
MIAMTRMRVTKTMVMAITRVMGRIPMRYPMVSQRRYRVRFYRIMGRITTTTTIIIMVIITIKTTKNPEDTVESIIDEGGEETVVLNRNVDAYAIRIHTDIHTYTMRLNKCKDLFSKMKNRRSNRLVGQS